MKHGMLFAGILAAVLLISGCGSSASTQPLPSDNSATQSPKPITADALGHITDILWTLDQLVINGVPVQVLDPRPTIQFEQTGRVTGFTSVNRYFGSLEFDSSGRIRWLEKFGLTRMAGTPELMEQETVFLDAIRKTNVLSVTSIRLDIPGPSGQSQSLKKLRLHAHNDDSTVRMIFSALEPQVP